MENMCNSVITNINSYLNSGKIQITINKINKKGGKIIMSTKTMKILSVVATILLIVSMGATLVSAYSPADVSAKDVSGISDVQTIGNQIVGIIQTVGVIASVIILMVLGIKYMMGSAEEKAEYKKTMIPYIIGAVLLFAASFLATAIYNFAVNIGQ